MAHGEEKQIDLLRDTPVRLIGYTNEVGEAFRALIPRSVVRLSYAIASTYVLVDTFDKGQKASKAHYASDNEKRKFVAIAAGDTLMWQAFASVIIPGYTINRICAASKYIFKKHTNVPRQTALWITTFIGLASIPLIFKPIDHFVDYAMDLTVRKLYNTKKSG